VRLQGAPLLHHGAAANRRLLPGHTEGLRVVHAAGRSQGLLCSWCGAVIAGKLWQAVQRALGLPLAGLLPQLRGGLEGLTALQVRRSMLGLLPGVLKLRSRNGRPRAAERGRVQGGATARRCR